MQSLNKLLLFSLSLLLSYATSIAQNHYIPTNTGSINFNLRNSTLNDTSPQTVSLYGCNTIITVNSTFWNGPTNGFEWNKENQVISGIPFGHQMDTIKKKPFYVSKYYIASPPVFNHKEAKRKDTNTRYDIGIVTPDEFVFKGEKPAEMVYLDYNILKTMYIEYIDVEYDTSFHKLDVDIIPINIQCGNFPWLDTNGITSAKGAAGIGALERKSSHANRLFLPYYYDVDSSNHSAIDSTKKYLDCHVSILNDILFHREVFFKVNNKKSHCINLTKDRNKKITLHCKRQKKLPNGCLEPRPQKLYPKKLK